MAKLTQKASLQQPLTWDFHVFPTVLMIDVQPNLKQDPRLEKELTKIKIFFSCFFLYSKLSFACTKQMAKGPFYSGEWPAKL